MKHIKIMALGALFFCMAATGQAQIFQVFQKTGWTEKFNAAQVDSLTHNAEEGLTLHLKDGTKETFLKAATDSVVWYDPTGSILSTLKRKGNYTYFLRLVQENEWWTDMMNGATDLTVFAADDNHWRSFFSANAKLPKNDPWNNATSYEKLLPSQKKVLLYSSFGSANASNADIVRFKSDIYGLDLLKYLPADEVPVTYNTNEKWYWERFHKMNGGIGLYLATDSSFRYTSFFTPEKAQRYGITDLDYAFLFPGASKTQVNGIDIIGQETATNGKIQSIVSPLKPLESMAEVIRTNGKTNIFSHLLDRLSAPFYSPVLTETYKELHPEFADSIFIKRYFSDNNCSTKAGYIRYDYNNGSYPVFEPGPCGTYQTYNPYKDDGYNVVSALKFDPGWAGYYDEVAPEHDMAAMFVPNDEALWYYFTKGAGQSLIQTYYAKEGTSEQIPYVEPTTFDELFRQIECIPANLIANFINNGMQRSFISSVPSKWGKLNNDAMEPLFDNTNDALTELDTCLLANNGMVYVMNKTFLPADYNSIIAPVFVNNTCRIMKSAIYDDFMSLNYYVYLKAPQQDITFFLPTDEAMAYYYDPISMKSRTPRVIKFTFVGGSFPVKLQIYNYYCQYNKDKGELGTIGSYIPGTSLYTNQEVVDRLKMILYSHTVVSDDTQDIHSRNEYYRTLGGDVVKVIRDASGNIVGAKGTFQIENERHGINTGTPGVAECNVTNSYESLSNGQTFTLNAPLVPTYRSLYSIMTNDANWHKTEEDGFGGETPYSEFYELCTADGYENEIIGCGLVDANLNKTQRESALKKYKIFVADNGLDYNFAHILGNTPYTAYIPTNEAVRRAIAQGLPTWEDIREDFYSHLKAEKEENEDGTAWVVRTDADGEIIYSDSLSSREDSLRIANKIITLTNVIKAHFHYGLAIADQEPFQKEYKSLFIDHQTQASPKLKVNSTGNGNMTVTDWNGHTFNVVGEKNVFVRDYSCSSSPVQVQLRGITTNAYRSGVVHQIDGVMGFK